MIQFQSLPPWLAAMVAFVALCFLCLRFAALLRQFHRLLQAWADTLLHHAMRPFRHSGAEVGMYLVAASAIALMLICDYYVLSFSFYVVFPDKGLRLFAGLCYTMIEMALGHCLSEYMGLTHHHHWLRRVASKRKRAIVCCTLLLTAMLLLVGEYGLAHRRIVLLNTGGVTDQVVLSPSSSGGDPSAASKADAGDIVLTANVSGLLALIVGLGDFLLGCAVFAAISGIVACLDFAVRGSFLVMGVTLAINARVLKCAASILRFPRVVIRYLNGHKRAIQTALRPLSIRLAVWIREPARFAETLKMRYWNARKMVANDGQPVAPTADSDTPPPANPDAWQNMSGSPSPLQRRADGSIIGDERLTLYEQRWLTDVMERLNRDVNAAAYAHAMAELAYLESCAARRAVDPTAAIVFVDPDTLRAMTPLQRAQLMADPTDMKILREAQEQMKGYTPVVTPDATPATRNGAATDDMVSTERKNR